MRRQMTKGQEQGATYGETRHAQGETHEAPQGEPYG